LMTVHDSFATTIDNVGIMAWAIRQAFYEVFDQYCPYQELLKQTMERLPDILTDKRAALAADDQLTDLDKGIIADAITGLSEMTGNQESRFTEAKAITKHVNQSVDNKAVANSYIQPIAQRMVTIPDVPEKLNLDLSEVLKSPYAFS
jgi:DNA-directed RNA polymerase